MIITPTVNTDLKASPNDPPLLVVLLIVNKF
jgi:hypothetical protein